MSADDREDLLPGLPTVDRALVDRLSAGLARDVRPVRPFPPTRAIVSLLLAAFAAVAITGAALLGFFGISRLSGGAVAMIFPGLVCLALLSGSAAVSTMIPGSKRLLSPIALMALGCAAMAVIFWLIFHDYSPGQFVRQGVICLRAGLLWMLPAAIGAALILRKGYAVNRGIAGFAVGTLAGLAGLAVLELHCPNFRFWHVTVWHVAVVPVSALLGWAVGKLRGADHRFPWSARRP